MINSWITLNNSAMYFASVVFVFVCGVASNTHSNKIKGRYILLGSIFWPFVIVGIFSLIIATVLTGVKELLKENFWDIF
jgi:hypothetical protein